MNDPAVHTPYSFSMAPFYPNIYLNKNYQVHRQNLHTQHVPTCAPYLKSIESKVLEHVPMALAGPIKALYN